MAVIRFTDRWIQSCCAKSARDDYADQLCPGLHLRISQRGAKTFSVMLRVHGRLQRRTLGRYPRLSLAQARDEALSLLRNAAVGVDPRQPRPQEIAPLSFSDLVDAYVTRHLKPNARTWKTIEGSLKRKELRPFRTRPAAGITKAEFVALIDRVAETMPGAAVSLLRRLNMMYNWAADRDMVPENPCERIPAPAKTNERDRILSDKEIAAVWKATAKLPLPYMQMYRMFLLTGQRRAEVSTMRWGEISGNVWVIPREKVKKDRPHAVPLTKTAMAVLGTLPCFAKGEHIFTTTDGRKPSSNFTKTRASLQELSGTSGWTIHDMRRTVRSKLAELGVSREIARKVVNHEDGKIDRIYNRHEYLSEKREALETWERHLLSLTTRHSHYRRST
jgi:integrase